MKQVGASASRRVIGITARIGEDYLEAFGGVSQKYFRTSQGARFVDQFVDDVAHESKVGYTALTKFIKIQIAKDAELLDTQVVSKVIWHFFKNPATGAGGPSKPLRNELIKAGIEIVEHKTAE